MDSFGWPFSQTSRKRLCRGLSRWTKCELNFPKSAQEIHTMQKNKHLSGVNWSLFKTSPDLLQVENVHFRSNPYISATVQHEHICIFTKAHVRASLSVLWLDVKVDKNKQHFSFNVIYFLPDKEISNSVKVFFAFSLFHYHFCYKKLMVPQVSLVPEVPELLRSADPHSSNTRQACGSTKVPIWTETSVLKKRRYVLISIASPT